MKLFLILLSCVVLASCGDTRHRTRLSRGILHGVDLRQILAAVEPGYNFYHNQPAVPAFTSHAAQYNAPRPLPQPQQFNAPELREELSSVAVAAAGAQGVRQHQPAPESVPQQQYGTPAGNVQPPQREYGTPQREYGTPPREYGTPAATSQNPSNQYGAPAPQKAQVEVSQPVPAQSYGVPSPNTAAPAQSYGAPTNNPSSEYGAPSGGSASASALSGLGGIDISRDVSIHVPAPESNFEQPRPQPQPQVRTPKKAKKHYKIIFIKAPAPPPPPVPEIPEIEPEPEQKTLVYVLVQKPEPAPPIVIPTPAPAPKSKPEVYFVKYRQAVREEGFASSSSSGHDSLDRGGYANTGYNAPSQQLDLPKTGY